jgi:hypothetical protein
MWIFKQIMRHSDFVRRCSAHALGDPREVKDFFEDLVTTGRQLEVPMPAMNSYAEDISRFAECRH